MKNWQKVFDKISLLIDAMNQEVLGYLGIKFEKREAYAVDYVSELLTMYKETTGLDETSFVSGRGRRKSIRQKQYEELHEYLERLKSYAYHIETCGEERNSYSKTDHDATFMRLKRDYMGNDQLLPAYNLQAAICDEIHSCNRRKTICIRYGMLCAFDGKIQSHIWSLSEISGC